MTVCLLPPRELHEWQLQLFVDETFVLVSRLWAGCKILLPPRSPEPCSVCVCVRECPVLTVARGFTPSLGPRVLVWSS